MLKDLLLGLWWILPGLAYVLVGVVVARRGLWATVGEKIFFVVTCVLILLIPTQHAHSTLGRYVLPVLIVLNLLLYRWTLRKGNFNIAMSPNRSDE